MSVFVLASASPRRRHLLNEAGFRFRVVPADIEEVIPEGVSPREAALLLAKEKARAVSGQHPGEVVLAADTLVALGEMALGKPRDLEEARRMLALLSGRTHQVYTGVCLLSGEAGQEEAFVETTDVQFRELASADIEAYFAVVDPLDKAGAYAAQEEGERIIASYAGSFTNVMGLPMEALLPVLERCGISSIT